MLKLLTCPRGHYWEKPVENGVESPLDLCPVCGDAAETMPLLEEAPSEAEPAVPAEPPPPPPLRDRGGRPVVAGYEILEDLGKGPTGIRHYKARQILVNRIVVLKVVFAGEDPGQIAWGGLRGEAAALGRLTHPNIVQIHEAGERERQLFYNAVEYVDGPTLAEALGDKPLPFRQAAALVEMLARAVHQAHEKNLLHRSLKPASILLPQGDLANPKITDFGLARRPIEGDVTDAELQGELPCHLAPEQAWGRAKEIGPATDVYGLGAILYELVTGRPPFCGKTALQTLEAVQCKESKPLGRLRSRVPADLDTICRKCLAKSPRRRYTSALDLADDLRRFADGLPIKGRQVGSGERLGKWMRRNYRALAFVLLLLWAGLSVLILSLSDGSGTARKPQEMNYRAEVTRLQNELAHVRRDASAASYLHSFVLAEREAREGDLTRARELLNRCPADQRQWEWYLLSNRLQRNGNAAVFSAGSTVHAVDFSPDGRYLLAGGGRDAADRPEGGEGQILLWDLITKAIVWEAKVRAPVRAVAFSPDGDQATLVVGSVKGGPNFVQARWTSTGQVVFTREYNESQLTTLVYSPDPTRLLVAGGDGLLRTLQSDTGFQLRQEQVTFRRVWPKGGRHVQLLPIGGPNRERMAVVSPDGGQIRVLRDRNFPGTTDLLGADNVTFNALAYDEREETVAAAGSDGTVRLWKVSSPHRPMATLRGHQGAVTGVAFSSDGKRLASCGADDTVRIWDPRQEQELLSLKSYKGAVGVRFQSIRPQQPWALGANVDVGMDEDKLAIIHGDKVTVLSPQRP